MDHKKFSALSTVSALLVLAVFAVGILGVLLGGVSVYRRLTDRDQAVYDRRTAAQYLTTKLRQAPGSGAVSTGSFGDGDALVITEQWEGVSFVTRIYCHEGWLMELYSLAEGEFSPTDGQKIVPMDSLQAESRNGLLELTLTQGEESRQVRFDLKEVAP